MINEQFVFDNPALFFALVGWSIALKGFALWKAAHRESKPWFIVLLFINTFGILELVYIFVVTRQKKLIDTKEDKTEKVEGGEAHK